MVKKVWWLFLLILLSSKIGFSKTPSLIALENPQLILKNLKEGDYGTALQSLKEIDSLVTQDQFSDSFYLLMGILAFNENCFDKALDLFQKAYSPTALLADYSSYWIGKTLNEQKKYGAALQWLKIPARLDKQIDLDIFWERIEALISHSQWAEANQLLTKHQRETLKDEEEQIKIKYHQGLIAFKTGQKTRGFSLFKQLLIKNAGNAYEHEINKEVKNQIVEGSFLNNEEKLERAKRLIDYGLPLQALEIYKNLSISQERIKPLIAQALFKARHYAEAAQSYQALADHPLANQDPDEILSPLASSYARSDQFDKALQINQKIIKQNPHSSSAQKARYRIAFIYFDSSQYEKAAEAFTDFLNQKVRYRTKEASWYRLWSYYLLKNYSQALIELEALAKKERSSDELLKITYWKARCLEQLGKKQESQQTFQRIISKQPIHYYAALASHRLKSQQLFPQTLIDTTKLNHIPQYGPSVATNEWENKLTPNNSLTKGVALAQIGLADYAYDETENYRFNDKDFNLIDQTCALRGAQNFNRLTTIGRSCLKKDLSYYYWTLAYPQAYSQWLQKYAKDYGLNPHLAWSIMREESHFKPKVVSQAKAIGLMQIIPQTGYEIAEQMGISDFHASDLKKPERNIQFGAWYLKHLVDSMEGNPIYAIASYNAGPEAVGRWKKQRGQLPLDEFIELIPYNETNRYVKKVLTSYWVYQRLYGK